MTDLGLKWGKGERRRKNELTEVFCKFERGKKNRHVVVLGNYRQRKIEKLGYFEKDGFIFLKKKKNLPSDKLLRNIPLVNIRRGTSTRFYK